MNFELDQLRSGHGAHTDVVRWAIARMTADYSLLDIAEKIVSLTKTIILLVKTAVFLTKAAPHLTAKDPRFVAETG